MYIVFILQYQKIQNKYQIVWNTCRYNSFQLCPRIYCYRFLLSLYMKWVPEKLFRSMT